MVPGQGAGDCVDLFGSTSEHQVGTGSSFQGVSLGFVFAQPPSLTCPFCVGNPEAERDQLEVGGPALNLQELSGRFPDVMVLLICVDAAGKILAGETAAPSYY